jgi:hypothetical protein
MSHKTNLHHVVFGRIGRQATRSAHRPKRPHTVLTKLRATPPPDQVDDTLDEDRPDLVFSGLVEDGETPCYGYGLCPEFEEGKFNLALFLDPHVPHWVDPVPSPTGLMAYQLEGPTRGGGWETVTVTLETDATFHCTCWQSVGCDHIRALKTCDLFTWLRPPYRFTECTRNERLS